MSGSVDRFLRDLERVEALGKFFSPRRRKNPSAMREVSPGVFVGGEPKEESHFGKLRRVLRDGDRVSRELGRRFKEEVR